MILRILWNALRRNLTLVLLLAGVACPVFALGEVTRGATWSLLMPVAVAAVLCSWGLARSRLNGRQAAGWLVVPGLIGVLIFASRLASPLWYLIRSVYLLIPQLIHWLIDRLPIDLSLVLTTWNEFSSRALVALVRLWEWLASSLAGKTILDPAAAGLAWSILLWLVCIWAGWQLKRTGLALRALAPGGIVMALALDYRRENTDIAVLFLIVLLISLALNHYKDLIAGWLRRGVDYSESVAFDSGVVTSMIGILVVTFAATTPSISLDDVVEKLRESRRGETGQVTERAGQVPGSNAAGFDEYRSNGLPRQLLLTTAPEQLEDVVMTVRVDEAPSDAASSSDLLSIPYYWRTVTYDLYTGVGWTSRSARETPVPAKTILIQPAPAYRTIHQRITLASVQNTRVYWTGTLGQADADIRVSWRVLPPSNADPLHSGDMLGALTDSNSYLVDSYLPKVSAAELRAAGRDYPAQIANRYLTVPDSVPDRVLSLARDLTGTELSSYDQAVALETYLRAIPYSLNVTPPPFGVDVVDYFLFSLKSGYCDYYASAMAIMARSVGIPARIVVGYRRGDYNPENGEYIVRKKHAHTWVELYFPEIGWVEFEPTGGPIANAQGRYPDESQSDNKPTPGLAFVSRLKTTLGTVMSTIEGAALFASLILIGALFLWQLGSAIYLHLLPSKTAIGHIYTRVDRVAMSLLPDLPRGHTPMQLQRFLSDKFKEPEKKLLRILFKDAPLEIEGLAALFIAQTFSQHPPSRAQVRRGIRFWARLRWKLWLVKTSYRIDARWKKWNLISPGKRHGD